MSEHLTSKTMSQRLHDLIQEGYVEPCVTTIQEAADEIECLTGMRRMADIEIADLKRESKEWRDLYETGLEDRNQLLEAKAALQRDLEIANARLDGALNALAAAGFAGTVAVLRKKAKP